MFDHLLPILQTILVSQTRHAGAAGEIRRNSKATFFNGLRYVDVTVMANQQSFIYNSSVCTLDAEDLTGAMDDWDGW